ncbi:MAG: 5'/3'-nucleotidase SurE [Candidatus Helarchaeota archaeon]
MVDILLTNDDGVYSLGFLALKNELKALGSLLLVGPREEKSWISKAISRFDPIRLQKIKLEDGTNAYSVDGTPVDATILGLFTIAKQLPKLVVSGINTGANAGNAFIFSSGTVGAALEAAMIGIPSMAVSVVPPHSDYRFEIDDFRYPAYIAKLLAQRILKYGLPANINLINLNIPLNATPETEIVVTNVAKLHYGCIFEPSERGDEFNFTRKMESTKGAQYDLQPGTDAHTVFVENKISITPINIDITGDLKQFKKWLKLKI